jgi:hypothetical protein
MPIPIRSAKLLLELAGAITELPLVMAACSIWAAPMPQIRYDTYYDQHTY